MKDRVYIVLLNWNGWRDTIDCLESALHNNYPNFKVVVCDNDSSDNSLDHIKAWADGQYPLPDNNSEIRQKHCFPVVDKPVSYVCYSRKEAEAGGSETDASLVLIQTGANLGFAGGNNVGIRYIQARDDYSFIWLLNNDTVIHADALVQLVNRMESVTGAGMCGSTVYYYHDPDHLQAQGGAQYVKWLGMGRHIGEGLPVEQMIAPEQVEQQLDYILGASMLISKSFIENIGLMNEEYFLYFEELDWALRAKGKFCLVYAPDSVVFHKEGGSIGTDSSGINRSLTSDYYLFKNRLIVTRKYFPWLLPLVYMRLIVAMLTRVVFGKWQHARTIGKILLTGK